MPLQRIRRRSAVGEQYLGNAFKGAPPSGAPGADLVPLLRRVEALERLAEAAPAGAAPGADLAPILKRLAKLEARPVAAEAAPDGLAQRVAALEGRTAPTLPADLEARQAQFDVQLRDLASMVLKDYDAIAARLAALESRPVAPAPQVGQPVAAQVKELALKATEAFDRYEVRLASQDTRLDRIEALLDALAVAAETTAKGG